MNRTLRYITDCLSGEAVHQHLQATDLSRSLGKNCLISVISDKDWEDIPVTAACFNSNDAQPGSVFFCMKGETTNGHQYAADAVQRGVTAIVAEHDPFASQRLDKRDFPPVFIVNNSLHALWRVALAQRDATRATVIGITGSAGKTSVKEILAHTLSRAGKTEKNQRSFNTQVGLPVSMINADIDADFWVIEVGISHAHDMDELGALLQPDVSIILNADVGHSEGLGELGVAMHKMKLGLYTAPGGTTYVNADYPKLMAALGSMKKQIIDRDVTIIPFSTKAPSKWRGKYLSSDGQTGQFSVRMEGNEAVFTAPFVGSYGAENLAVIVAVATHFGIDTETIQAALLSASLPAGRFFRHEFGTTTLIDDSYNANPLSATRMIEAASVIARETQRDLVLVMGEMLELGGEAQTLHTRLGQTMAQAHPKAVIWKGGQYGAICKGLQEEKYTGGSFQANTEDEFTKLASPALFADSVILVKGSRSNRLEKYVAIIKDTVKETGRAF